MASFRYLRLPHVPFGRSLFRKFLIKLIQMSKKKVLSENYVDYGI